jgi:ribonuclease HI
MNKVKAVTLITDGACIGNPGPGGWACLLRHGQHSRELYGSAPNTTNNRMELTAVIQGLSALKEPCDITIVTDSEYVQKGVTGWMARWKQNGWRTAGKKQPVKNQDLWETLDQALAPHRVSWQWVKGHGVHADNNRVDQLANAAARGQTASPAAGNLTTE